MTSASASPTARTLAASARPTRSIFAASPAPSNSSSFCVASALMMVACFSPLGAQDRGLALGLGRLHDRGLQLLFPAQRLPAPGRAPPALAHLIDARFLLGDLLPGDGGRERARPAAASACLAWTAALNSACRVSLSRSDCAMVDVGLVALGLALLVGVGRLDHRVALGERFADDRVALDLGGALLAERVEVALLVADLLDGQDVDVDAHLLEIDGRLVGHLLREGLAVGVDLLDGQRAEDRPQVPFERLEDDALDLFGRHAEEALGGARAATCRRRRS